MGGLVVFWEETRRVRILSFIALAVFFLACETIRSLKSLSTCTTRSIARSVSPTGKWIIQIDETICDAGPLSNVTSDMLLCPAEVGTCVDLMGVDTSDPADIPKIFWASSNRVTFKIPNQTYLKILVPDPIGIAVDIIH